ncbi:uroporphyrinogen-III synthase [Tessaracoccus sp. Z1128]
MLAGLRILLTQADGALADALRAAGAEVVAQPVQRRVTLRPDGSFDRADWVAFTSAATLEVIAELGLTVPAGARVAAVGPRTAAAAEAAGLTVDLVPAAESSAAALARAWPEGSGRVVIPGSALSSTVLADALRAKGYGVEVLPLYTMEPLDHLPGVLVYEWRDGLFDAVAVTSGSAGAAVGRLLGWRDDTAVVAFGPPSAEALRREGASVAAVAATQDAEGLIRAISSIGREHP